ncbi:MAG: hypothetical protein Q7K26_01270 [bacterium]|nr:hypothetical protein [bacterium]
MQAAVKTTSINNAINVELFDLKIAHPKSPTKSLQCFDPLASIKHTDWYFIYIETIDLRLCSFENLNDAFNEAPNEAAEGYIRAIYDMRSLQSSISGAIFN